MSLPTVEIPNRSLFRQPEVCEIAQVQPYVLRSWEAEFPDLGVCEDRGRPARVSARRMSSASSAEAPAVCRRADARGCATEAGSGAGPAVAEPPDELDELLGSDVRERLMLVKRGLRELQMMLDEKPNGNARPGAVRAAGAEAPHDGKKKKPAKKAGKKKAS